MKKVLISLTAILLLSACTSDRADKADKADRADKPDIDWNGLTLVTDAKCGAVPLPEPGSCNPDNPGQVTALITVDSNGAPISVAPIQSCKNGPVTWEYEAGAFPKGDEPPFFIIFDPTIFPGRGTYRPISSLRANSNNQELKINQTRARAGNPNDPNRPAECLNYLIVTPGKGILDPVFIIKY